MISTNTLKYQPGFANEFESEALAGAIPIGQNSPQRPPYGLFSELISGTTFTAPRKENRRTYVFRIRPSVGHGPFRLIESKLFLTPPFSRGPDPNQMRWNALPIPSERQDFIEGMTTICGNGTPELQTGMSMHVYLATRSMRSRAFSNADGDLVILPQEGAIRVVTEMGLLDAVPSEVVLIPRGLKFRVDLLNGSSRGFVCENYGAPFQLPELGPIGSNGLANAYDFLAPVAAYEDSGEAHELICKYGGTLWSAELDHSPFDVVAWRGSLAPFKYDTARFVSMGTTSVDHPDPSIYSVLSSPSDRLNGPNADFMIVPERWLVAENTLRPPGFHRNAVSEILGIIFGAHDSKRDLTPGGFTIHNNWAAHGPDVATYEAARVAPLDPVKVRGSLVFMFETRFPLRLTEFAFSTPARQTQYQDCWNGFQKRFADGRAPSGPAGAI